MRDEAKLEVAKEALEDRMERDSDYALLLAFYHPKREVINAVLHGDKDPQQIHDSLQRSLRKDMDLGSFIKIQAGINAASWVLGEFNTL